MKFYIPIIEVFLEFFFVLLVNYLLTRFILSRASDRKFRK